VTSKERWNMPSRTDEFWASDKDGELRYCGKHKRYYKSDFGCQLCEIEYIERGLTNYEKVVLIECPTCGKKSLSWFVLLNHYECMNSHCKEVFTERQISQIIQSRKASELEQQNRRSSDSNKQNHIPETKNVEVQQQEPHDLLKCPICWKTKLYLDSGNGEYNCLNCRRIYSPAEYEELKKKLEDLPAGKPWFGNEYYDSKKKKWRKP
jgi:hypothetical protein